MKLIRDRKVEPLYKRTASVQNILKDTLARNEFKHVIVIGMDNDGYISSSSSKMWVTQKIGMIEVAKQMYVDELK